MLKATISRYDLPGGLNIERRSDVTWALVLDHHVLSNTGELLYEPLPSSRSEEFLAATRFCSAEEAYANWERFVQKLS